MGVTASRTDEYAVTDDPTDGSLPESSGSLTTDDRNRSSLTNITTTEFVWSFGGSSVYVTGAWDDWRVKAALSRTSPTDFTAVLALPVGTFQYKFIVDGNWKYVTSSLSQICLPRGPLMYSRCMFVRSRMRTRSGLIGHQQACFQFYTHSLTLLLFTFISSMYSIAAIKTDTAQPSRPSAINMETSIILWLLKPKYQSTIQMSKLIPKRSRIPQLSRTISLYFRKRITRQSRPHCQDY